MGMEYEGVKLTDIYNKANPNKIAQKYGKTIIIELVLTHKGEPSVKRVIKNNPECPPPQVNTEEEVEEEKMLDE